MYSIWDLCLYQHWDFCKSFHSISIVSDVIHELGLQWKNTEIIKGLCHLGQLKNHSDSFCGWRAEERADKVWLTVPEYIGDMNQKRSCPTVAGEFIDLWFMALQGPFGMQKEKMMKGTVSHGEKQDRAHRDGNPWERKHIQMWPTAWEREWGIWFFLFS